MRRSPLAWLLVALAPALLAAFPKCTPPRTLTLRAAATAPSCAAGYGLRWSLGPRLLAWEAEPGGCLVVPVERAEACEAMDGDERVGCYAARSPWRLCCAELDGEEPAAGGRVLCAAGTEPASSPAVCASRRDQTGAEVAPGA